MVRIFRKRVPVVLQIERTECGAASLCMILAFYGRHIELSQMRADCCVSRDGSNLGLMMKAARKHGMIPQAMKAPATLKGIHLPAIVFWRYSHFVVVERITDKWVWLCDPEIGRRKIEKKEFEDDYSGVVLSLTKSKKFEPCASTFKESKVVSNMLKNTKFFFIFFAFIMLLLNTIGILIPQFTKLFVDYSLPSLSADSQLQYFSCLFVIMMVQIALLYVKKRIIMNFKKVQSFSISCGIVKKALRLPLSYFQQRSHTTIVSRITSINSLADFISSRFVPTTMGLLFSLIYIVLLLYYSVTIGVIILLFIAMILTFLIYFMHECKEDTVKASNEQIKLFGEVSQTLRLFDTIKSTSMENITIKKLICSYRDYENSCQNSKIKNALLRSVPAVVPMVIQTVVMCVGGVLVINRDMTIGELLACQSVATSIFAPLTVFIYDYLHFKGKEADIMGMHDIQVEKDDPLVVRRGEHNNTNRFNGHIELKYVSFGYNPALPPIVKDITVSIPKGNSVAFVGKSGSGKTTILKLLEGLYVPRSGEILLDGIPLHKTNREEVSNAVAIIGQEPLIFTGSIRDNITLFNPNIRTEDIISATKDACIYDDILLHTGSFNAMMSPGFAGFSGGQIQRIMIARALVKKPSVLIMDEATSALDAIVEEKVMNNIKKKGITLIVVAHRLSTIRDCNEIIVLEKGRIVERGSHNELLGDNFNIYKDLVLSEDTME